MSNKSWKITYYQMVIIGAFSFIAESLEKLDDYFSGYNIKEDRNDSNDNTIEQSV
ncbi:hypothetical protein ACFQO1_05995 [Jejudonia soesokkakensis]|uniref:Uncharacterized protein n=1 Tax=Jejudonia soesokkakensis TaxID=1323432 RepID=A0ABW2MV49_9FLAO